MRHIGLFEGIGGFSLAARWMGWNTIAWCEINPFCQKVLRHHFPEAKEHGDITKTDFTIYRGQCDIVTGGFPCQPYSVAGKRLGKEDDRHLWPEMLRAVREIQPRYVVGENVRGLINWNGGMVFDEVQADLEAEGYEVLPFLLPACAVNAPHRRDRIWFVANASSMGWKNIQGNTTSCFNSIAYTERNWEKRERRSEKANELDSSSNTFLWFQEMHGQPAIYDVDYGLPFELDGITVPSWIEESFKAGGNAIVPQIAFEIFKAIELTQTNFK